MVLKKYWLQMILLLLVVGCQSTQPNTPQAFEKKVQVKQKSNLVSLKHNSVKHKSKIAENIANVFIELASSIHRELEGGDFMNYPDFACDTGTINFKNQFNKRQHWVDLERFASQSQYRDCEINGIKINGNFHTTTWQEHKGLNAFTGRFTGNGALNSGEESYRLSNVVIMISKVDSQYTFMGHFTVRQKIDGERKLFKFSFDDKKPLIVQKNKAKQGLAIVEDHNQIEQIINFGSSIKEDGLNENEPTFVNGVELRLELENNEDHREYKSILIDLEYKNDLINLLEDEFEKYPRHLLDEYVDSIYVVKRLNLYDKWVGGTYNTRTKAIYAVVNMETESSRNYFAETIHHELSSIFYYKFRTKLNLRKWQRYNKEDYGFGGHNAIKYNLTGKVFSKEYLERGNLSAYGASDIENDINTFAENLFSGDRRLWQAAKNYEVIQHKLNVMIDFYASIDPFFSEDFFRGLVKKSPNFELSFDAGDKVFPKSWLNENINASATPLPSYSRDKFEVFVKRLNAEESAELVNAHVNKLYLFGGFRLYNKNRTKASATGWNVIYLKVDYQTSYQEFRYDFYYAIQKLIEHKNEQALIDKALWAGHNGFEYGKGLPIQQVKRPQDKALANIGLLKAYGNDSIDFDIRSFATYFMMGKEEIHFLTRQYPRIKNKMTMIAEYYQHIDPVFAKTMADKHSLELNESNI